MEQDSLHLKCKYKDFVVIIQGSIFFVIFYIIILYIEFIFKTKIPCMLESTLSFGGAWRPTFEKSVFRGVDGISEALTLTKKNI